MNYAEKILIYNFSEERMTEMKKRLVLLITFVIGAAALVSCGPSPDPVTQETSLGVNLEKKAKDVTGQAAEDEEEANELIDNIDNLENTEE